MMTTLLSLLSFAFIVYLHTRLDKVNRRLTQIEQEGRGASTHPSVVTAVTPAQQPTQSVISETKTREKGKEFDLLAWIAKDWLLKLGSLLVLLGVGWFVTYAFAQNWIGPLGRISLGLVAGTIVLAAGYLRAFKNERQGTVLLVLGAAVVLITTYAAREVYNYFTPVSALAIMAAAASFVAFTSVQQNSVTRALAGLLLACVAPFLTVSADPSVTGLFMYLFVVMFAFVWIVVLKGWKEVLVLATGLYAMFSVGALQGMIPKSEVVTLQILVTAFVVLFYGIGIISALRTKQVLLADVVIKVVSAAVFLYWTHELVPQHMQSLIAGAASLMSIMSAWMLMTSTKNKWLVLLHGALALVYLAVAAAFELESPARLYAFIGLSVVGVWLASKITKNKTIAQWFGLPFVYIGLEVVRLLTTRSMLQTTQTYQMGMARGGMPALVPVTEWNEVFVSFTAAAAVLSLGWYLSQRSSASDEEPAPAGVVVGYFWAGIVLAVITIWAAFEKLPIAPDTAHGWALVIYAIAGILLYVYGKLHSHTKKMLTGGLLLGAVVVRLLLVEVWSMELTARVVVFLLIGVLLILAAFVRPQVEKGST